MIRDLLNVGISTVDAIWSIFIICCVIGILLGLHMKNQKEKREALNMTVIVSVVFIIISALFELAGQLVGSTTIGQRISSLDILEFLVIAYVIIYGYLSYAKSTGKASYRIKLYSNLEELENWLNEIGKKGYVCTDSKPELYLFKLKQEKGKQYFYKAEYVSGKKKETEGYIAENERKGWHVALKSSTSKYDMYEATILVFYTMDPVLESGNINRHHPDNLSGRLFGTIIANLVLAIGLLLVNVFLLPNDPAMQFLTALILCILGLQIALRVNFALGKKNM